MKLTPQQVNTICKGDPEIVVYFNMLLATIDRQAKQIEKLEKRVHELERQLGQNSTNSSKPPSSDGPRKPTNLRTPGGKKGAPKGHGGHTLRFALPDEIVVHSVLTCSRCSRDLQNAPVLDTEKRQVFDLPAPRVVVTEHRVEKKCCPSCGLAHQGHFPAHIAAPTQYGDGFAAWTAYLHAYQLLPLARVAQLFEDLTGYRPSEATLLSYLAKTADCLQSAERSIREHVAEQPVVHADETGLRVEGKGHWLHTISTHNWTLLGMHESRGSKGMDALGFLPVFQGTVVHDCYAAYFKGKYTFKHALCNVHLLRECQEIEQFDQHKWATQMRELLFDSWNQVKAAREKEQLLEPRVIQAIQQRYDVILAEGRQEWEHDAIREKTGPRGRKVKSKAANLGARFMLYKEAILRFIWDADVPFDNNQAERDVRMAKVKQKISGTFRTQAGAAIFARIRGVISTLLKQKLPVLSSLTSAIRGQFSF